MTVMSFQGAAAASILLCQRLSYGGERLFGVLGRCTTNNNMQYILVVLAAGCLRCLDK